MSSYFKEFIKQNEHDNELAFDKDLSPFKWIKILVEDRSGHFQEIQKWLKKHNPTLLQPIAICNSDFNNFSEAANTVALRITKISLRVARQMFPDINGISIQPWELSLVFLCEKFSSFKPLSPWEYKNWNDRKRHCDAVARRALELAELLRANDGPEYPDVLECFDDEIAYKMLRSLSGGVAKATSLLTREYLKERGFSDREVDISGMYIDLPNSARLLAEAHRTPKAQKWPELLDDLAFYAQEIALRQKRIERVSVGNPNARLFAQHISDYFQNSYLNENDAKRTVYADRIVAACVNIRFEDAEADEDLVKSWCGRK